MDRTIVYSQEQARTFDVLNGWKDGLKGIGNAVNAVLGAVTSVVSGFSAAQNGTPNMTITMASGQIYQFLQIDTTPWGALGTDAGSITQQGTAIQQILTFSTAALVAGQSQYVLVSAQYSPVDAVRTGDPSGGVLPYYNSANQNQPLQGPAGGGAVQNTVRSGVAAITITYGAPATAGAQVPPSVPANNVPLYLLILSFGQTTITNGQILVAGPAVYSGVPQAPFLAGLLNSHHNGNPGQAPKIQLGNAAEVQGILPLANCPGTSTYTTNGGALAVIRYGTGNPQGSLAANVGDLFIALDTFVLYFCITTGSATTAVWKPTGGSGGAGTVTSVGLAQANLPFLSITGSPVTGTGVITINAAIAAGSIPYGSATNVMSNLGIGSNGQVLSVVSGAPAWSSASSNGKPVFYVTSFPYTIAQTYGTYICLCTAGADCVINLPTTASATEVTIKRIDAQTNKLIITPQGGQNVETTPGAYASTNNLLQQGQAETFSAVSSTSTWYAD